MASDTPPAVSARLAAAQEQLHRRRRHFRQKRITRQLSPGAGANGEKCLSPRQQGQEKTASPLLSPEKSCHLGWESENLARSMRAARERHQARLAQEEAMSGTWLLRAKCRRPPCTQPTSPLPTPPTEERDVNGHVTLHPDVALAMLRNDHTAAGRIWLLLRYVDIEGSGWVNVSTARAKLTGKASPLRVCGWRQLRNLLAQGDGIFWHREGQERRIWLRSLVKVATTLGVYRLHVHPVRLPVSVLLESIGAVRAHFYASYHSGRDSTNPIARETLTSLANISRRTQQLYEKKAGVEHRTNWAIGQEFSKKAAQNRGWRQGTAFFKFKDRQGKTGAPGKSYLAWQLPNSYVGPHEPYAITRRKRINRKLVDLFRKGITGNGRKTVEAQQRSLAESEAPAAARYYERGTTAAKAYNRSAQEDIYWKSRVALGQRRVWHVLPGRHGP